MTVLCIWFFSGFLKCFSVTRHEFYVHEQTKYIIASDTSFAFGINFIRVLMVTLPSGVPSSFPRIFACFSDVWDVAVVTWYFNFINTFCSTICAATVFRVYQISMSLFSIETAQASAKVTIVYECDLSNGIISNDLGWPLTAFQGHGTFQRRLSLKRCILATKLL